MKENVLRIVVFSIVVLAFIVVLDGMFTGYAISFQGADGPEPALTGGGAGTWDLGLAFLVIFAIIIVILAFKILKNRKSSSVKKKQ